jgi:hypothetical protein
MVTGKTRTDACDAASHVQPVGPPLLAVLKFALGALEPAGLSAQDRLEGFAIINGAVLNFVRTELASQAANRRPSTWAPTSTGCSTSSWTAWSRERAVHQDGPRRRGRAVDRKEPGGARHRSVGYCV